MGVLPALESLQRLPPPDSPPELASPSAASSSSRSSPLEDQAPWGTRKPAPSTSMSRYDKALAPDMSVESTTEINQGRPESVGNSAVRQQLPSLSSLFGPPSTVRSLNSPHLERPAQYPSHSPLDRPRLPSSGNGTGSYFPRTVSPPASQPRSTYDERQPGQALPSPFHGPRSPGYHNINRSRSDSRTEPETPGRWSLHHEASRQEYSLGPRDASFRSPRDQFPPQFIGPQESPRDFVEPRTAHLHNSNSNPSQSPAIATPAEVTVSKDGLGPKIWTGTHFLPRFVRAAEVPGEGMCYFYDDGSHCKTVIDGEAVNAIWGVTKAGKPRKRLAIACVTCREKKIKCDPDYPRCVQCEKFGRVCGFKNAPRGGHNTSPSTSPAELDDGRQPRIGEGCHSVSDSGSPRPPRSQAHPGSPEGGYSKRLKIGPDAYVSNGEPPISMNTQTDHSKSLMTEQRPAPDLPRIPEEVLSRAWKTDPYVSDPQSITAVLTKFFLHVDSTMILRFLPEEFFKNWVAGSVHRKSPEDMMLLYSTLAVGVALSGGSKHIAFEYAQVAHYAQKMTDLQCLQLVQSRILLAVYYISTRRTREAMELIASAAATASCLELGLELDVSSEQKLTTYPLNLNKAGYSEARRRTFWSLFMLERLSGLFPERPSMINAEDIYTRLPADSPSFEKLVEGQVLRFDPYQSTLTTTERAPDIAAFVVEMTHIWAECQAAIYRMAFRPTPTTAETMKLESLIKKTEAWRGALPSRMTFGGGNLESAAFAGNVGSFLTMHLLYHHSMIELYRHRHGASRFPKELQMDHLKTCQQHATAIINILDTLERMLRVRPAILHTPPPAMEIAVTEAVDVLTATGSVTALSDLIETVRVAKSAVDKMSSVWEASSSSSMAIDQRIQKLYCIRDQGPQSASPIQGYRLLPISDETKENNRWQIFEPIEQVYPKDMDVMYVTFD